MEFIETAVVCDSMSGIGHEPKILGNDFNSNIPNVKIIGRARTILLRKKNNFDDPDKLYDGLRFLDTIKKGEIIVIANGFKEHAYWGELMSTFAKRNGAIGAIVDGCTRDKSATIEIKFPVFAKKWYGKDLRNFGIVAAVDCAVIIDSVEIHPGDLIAADADGIVIIPPELEKDVLHQAAKIINNEKKIKSLLNEKKTAKDLLKICGDF